MRLQSVSTILTSLLVRECLSFSCCSTPSRRSTTQLSVTIYSPDGVLVDDDEDSQSDLFSSQDDNGSLMDLISTEATAELARLAVVFSPPDQSLALDQIEKVNVLSIDTSHITIEAVLCETDGCVTLAIPVSFPSPCEGQDLTQCVIENVSLLDSTANADLKTRSENQANFEDIEHKKRIISLLKKSDGIELPEWWEAPGSLNDECNRVRSLLNEDDFLSDVEQLAIHSLVVINDEWRVNLAAVAMVGPAGLMLRTQVLDTAGKENIISLPVPFGKSCNTVESLRAVVLGTVAAATADISDEAIAKQRTAAPIISADDIF